MSRFPLSYPSFRWLWSSSLCAYMSMWIQGASIAWLVYELTGSAAMVGAVAGVRIFPLLALAPLSGVAADRYDRRKLLQVSQGLASATVLALGFALAFDRVSIWMLFVFALVTAATNVLDRPARHSTVFELVPREIAPQAITLNIIGNSSMRVLGPAIAGLLIASVGIAGNFFVQGVLYLASGLLVFLVVFPPRRPAAKRASAWKDMREGLKYAASDRTTRLLMSIAAIQYFLLVPTFNTLFPVFAKHVFGVGPQGLGLMFTMVGVGGVTGGLIAGALMRLDRIGLIQTGAMLVFAAALAALALAPAFSFALGACAVCGAAEMVVSTNNQTMLQMSAPTEMRGRIISLIQLNPALIAAGSFVSGPMGDWLGARGAAAVAATLATAIVVVMLVRSPRLRALRLSSYRHG
jgi:MFS transporter, DHA1 family, staphyloferrin A biosynthesis exporter